MGIKVYTRLDTTRKDQVDARLRATKWVSECVDTNDIFSLRRWYFIIETKYCFYFSPLKFSSSNWSVSSADDMTSPSFAAMFALLSMAECFKILRYHYSWLFWCLQAIHIYSTDIINPVDFYHIKFELASRYPHICICMSNCTLC